MKENVIGVVPLFESKIQRFPFPVSNHTWERIPVSKWWLCAQSISGHVFNTCIIIYISLYLSLSTYIVNLQRFVPSVRSSYPQVPLCSISFCAGDIGSQRSTSVLCCGGSEAAFALEKEKFQEIQVDKVYQVRAPVLRKGKPRRLRRDVD